MALQVVAGILPIDLMAQEQKMIFEHEEENEVTGWTLER